LVNKSTFKFTVMLIIRDCFQLKFGHYKEAIVLIEEAKRKNLIPQALSRRILSDFTGDAYRLVLESGYESLSAYEKSLQEGLAEEDWKNWYEQFKTHVVSSCREIMKEVG